MHKNSFCYWWAYCNLHDHCFGSRDHQQAVTFQWRIKSPNRSYAASGVFRPTCLKLYTAICNFKNNITGVKMNPHQTTYQWKSCLFIYVGLKCSNHEGIHANLTILHGAVIDCRLIVFQQGKSEGFDSCDRPSNLAQIWSKSSIFQPVWPWNLMDDLLK